MQLAKPLKLNPRQLAETLRDGAAGPAAFPALGGCGRDCRPRLHQHPAQTRGQAAGRARGAGRRRALWRTSRATASACWSSSSRPTRPARCTWATAARPRWATPSATCSQTQGWEVYREFYYNDAGVQIGTLANSTQLRAKGFKPGDACWPTDPETRQQGFYNGDYIADIAADFLAKKTVHVRRPRIHRQRRRERPGRHPPVCRGLPAPRAGPGPAGLCRQV